MKKHSNPLASKTGTFVARCIAACCICFATASMFFGTTAQSAPFRNLTVNFKQPDGTQIAIIGNGDEFSAFFETADGYTVVFDPVKKAYCFAQVTATGELIPCNVQAHQGNPAALGIAKHLRPAPDVIAQQARTRFERWENTVKVNQQWNQRKMDFRAMASPKLAPAPPGSTTVGDKLGLCLLIDFDDDPATIPQADIDGFCNGANFTKFGNNGSVRQYYLDNSNGKLNYSNVVTVYIRIPNSLHPKSYYNDTKKDAGTQANLLIQDAITIMKALPNYTSEILPTFNNLTVDANGLVVAFNVFYAGDNGGVWSLGLWPHSSGLDTIVELSPGGKKLFRYQISNIGDALELGTFCHENGHMLCGYPDIYDYQQDSAGGAGDFCLMDYGAFGGNPSQICAYLKKASGWATITDLTSASGVLAVVTASPGTNFNHFYRYQKPGVATEYFLIENRNASGRDAGLPASGVAIWHIDELGDKDNQSMIPNSVHNNYEVTLVQADNLWDFENNVNPGDPNDLYYRGNTARGYENTFSDDSSPNAHWWDGTPSGLWLHEFTNAGPTMTFAAGSLIPMSLQYQTNSVFGGNNNGLIDPNECNQMNVVITNSGIYQMTGVRCILSSATPGVFIATTVAAFPDAAAGALITNSAPFGVSTSPDFICGSPIDFTLAIKTDQGNATNQFRVTTGLPGASLHFEQYPMAMIPDGVLTGTNSTITVSNIQGALAKVKVSVSIQHPFVYDLKLDLIAPDGTAINLAKSPAFTGADFGNGLVGTIFDDDALKSINQGVAPFLGSYRPMQPLSAFIGKSGTNINGGWTLRVTDQYTNAVGVLIAWGLDLQPYTCADGGGECPGVDLSVQMSASPNPVASGGLLTYSLLVSNAGPSSANNVILAHNFPDGSTFVSAAVSQGGFADSGNGLNFSLGRLAAGKFATATVTVVPAKSGMVSSMASVVSSSDDYNSANDWTTVLTLVTPPRSDLAITMTDSPDPVLVGGQLTYKMNVVNYGPSPATNVVVTNYLSSSVILNNITSSQGDYFTSGNMVLTRLGVMPVNAAATITITVTPTAVGQIASSAVVGSDQSDFVLGNNQASTTTTVSLAADLSVSIASQPSQVLLNGLFTNNITLTNFGPGTAQNVSLKCFLPAGLVLQSAVCGTNVVITNVADLVSVNLDTLSSGQGVILSVVLQAPAAAATLTTYVTVSSSLMDPNTANNSASCTTIVAPPLVDIQPAGTTLVLEGLNQTNGVIDANERVTVKFWLKNLGTINASNVTATLLSGGGVSSPVCVTSSNCGNMTPGFTTNVQYAFTAVGSNGMVNASFAVAATSQIGSYATNITFSFELPKAFAFTNSNAITIPDHGLASPYPSVITTEGITGTVVKVTATLNNFSHTYPRDVSVMLVSPVGRKSILMAHGGGGYNSSVTNLTLTFDDSATISLPASMLISGSYRPAGYGVTYSPSDTFADATSCETNMAIFTGANPNGTWSLYVIDDHTGDLGSITSGWSLSVFTTTSVNSAADIDLVVSSLTNRFLVGQSVACTFNIANNGPNVANNVVFRSVLPNGLTFDDGQTSFTTNFIMLPVGSGPIFTKMIKANALGTFTCSNSAYASELDLNLFNNTGNLVLQSVMPTADIGISLRAETNIVSLDDLSCNLTLTNGGPESALGVVLTNLLPSGVVFAGFSGNWTGTWSTNAVVSGGVTNTIFRCDLGTIPSGGITNVSWKVRALRAMSLTNTVTAWTASTDVNQSNNVASWWTSVVDPTPVIVSAGTRLYSENCIQNGSIDPGETVTMEFRLKNTGRRATTNLVALIKSISGIVTIAQTPVFGDIAVGMTNACVLSFTSVANSSQAATVTFTLCDVGGPLGDVTFSFGFPARNAFSNATGIIIPEQGPASPYPSMISVSGITGIVSQASVTLKSISHKFPRDINAFLVSPAGQKLVLMSHAGASYGVNGVTLTFTNAPAPALPGSSPIYSGCYLPTSFGALPPFLGDPSVTSVVGMEGFVGTEPNGIWSLYVYDDTPGDGGAISGGWDLALNTLVPIEKMPPTPAALSVAQSQNALKLIIQGRAGISYSVRASSDLVTWETVDTVVAGADGKGTFDVGALTNKARFYQVITLP